jgi:hypothetical protein
MTLDKTLHKAWTENVIHYKEKQRKSSKYNYQHCRRSENLFWWSRLCRYTAEGITNYYTFASN